jgi:hypothetical protein
MQSGRYGYRRDVRLDRIYRFLVICKDGGISKTFYGRQKSLGGIGICIYYALKLQTAELGYRLKVLYGYASASDDYYRKRHQYLRLI